MSEILVLLCFKSDLLEAFVLPRDRLADLRITVLVPQICQGRFCFLDQGLVDYGFTAVEWDYVWACTDVTDGQVNSDSKHLEIVTFQ